MEENRIHAAECTQQEFHQRKSQYSCQSQQNDIETCEEHCDLPYTGSVDLTDSHFLPAGFRINGHSRIDSQQ